jgi:Ca2+/Na+ antiporter
MEKKKSPTDIEFVKMYYEHQYDRMAKQEEQRMTITNYVLTLSAIVFTFGFQGNSQLTIINGIGLPLIIMVANMFAVLYIERSAQFMKMHQNRAGEVMKRYAPELKEINDKIIATKPKFWDSRRRLQKGLHLLLICTALIPIGIFIYQNI